MSQSETSMKEAATSPRNFYVIAAVLGCAALAALALFVARFWAVRLSPVPEHWGQFGDYIGGVLGTLAGLGTLWLLWDTVRLQRRMIVLAQDQLETSRKELQVANTEMARSNRLLQQQSFEATFFRMMELTRTAAEATYWTIPLAVFGDQRESREVSHAQQLADTYLNVFGELAPLDDDEVVPCVQATVVDATESAVRRDWLNRFCGATYHTLKLIHYSKLPEVERTRYASILRSQFTDAQIVCIHFDLVAGRCDYLAPYVNFYGFLKHVPAFGAYSTHSPLAYGPVRPWAFLGYKRRRELGIQPEASIAIDNEGGRLGLPIT